MDDPKYDILIMAAIRNEDKAYVFYSNLSKRVENKDLERIFVKLAIQEKQHQRILEEFEETGNFMQVIDKIDKQKDGYIKENSDDKFDAISRADLINAFKLAIKMEEVAHDDYKKLYDSVTQLDLKKFFAMLMDFESEHKRILVREYMKITGEILA
jgi:rubrerythrin